MKYFIFELRTSKYRESRKSSTPRINKKISGLAFCSHEFHKMENYFIFEKVPVPTYKKDFSQLTKNLIIPPPPQKLKPESRIGFLKIVTGRIFTVSL